MSMIHPVFNSVMRNNIFQGNKYAFEEPFTGSSGHDWNYDNWYTTRGSAGPHFKWENVSYNTIANLCGGTKLECKGHEIQPGFVNPDGSDFTLLSTSPNVDRGAILPGINDNFKGDAPDIGAYESEFDLPPVVLSVTRTDPVLTNAASVNFLVSFSEPVTGVDANDFAVSTSGSLTGASVIGMSGSGSTYVVSVNTGSQDGMIGLSVRDDDSIVDSANNPLGAMGPGTGDFMSGETYRVLKSVPLQITATNFWSNKAYDGWILESGKNTGQGGSLDAVSSTFYLGDNAQDRQFRAIFDFNTSTLPDNALIITATLKIKKLSVTGVDPFTAHGNILVDIVSGSFDGVRTLQSKDFQAAASMDSAGTILNSPADNWYSAALDQSALQYINTKGPTQFRLEFHVPNDGNMKANTIKFQSGDSLSPSYRPMLQIEYYAP
jgi:hypothetical protein